MNLKALRNSNQLVHVVRCGIAKIKLWDPSCSFRESVVGSRGQSPLWNPRCALRAGRTLTAATWSNSVSPPRLLLAHCSSKPVSVPALAKPALYDGVANMSVAQHLRQRESPIFFVAVCRRWVAESLDCLGECDGAGRSTKAVGRGNLWSITNRGFATLPLWAILHAPS